MICLRFSLYERLFPPRLSVEIVLVLRELAETPPPPGSLPQRVLIPPFPGLHTLASMPPGIYFSVLSIFLPPALGRLLFKGWNPLSHRAGLANVGGIELNVLAIAAS